MNERMYNEIKEILSNTKGDVIDFRVYKGLNFSFLVKLAHMFDKHAVGIDTFYGLESPSNFDYNEHNQIFYPKGYAHARPEDVYTSISKICPPSASYELHEGCLTTVLSNIKSRKYSLALIDLLQYYPTKSAIEYIHKKMNKGGVLYFLNYNKDSNCLASKAIDEFIESNAGNITVHPDVYINDNKLPVCKITIGVSNKKHNSIKVKKGAKTTKKVSNRIKPDHSITLALVLKTGGDTYNYKYVNTLLRNILEKTTIDFKISVLTDNAEGIDMGIVDEIIPFKHNYPKWWGKIELFRPGIFSTDQVVYIDLDTIIVDNIDEILQWTPVFAGIRDLYHWNILQTGFMIWKPQYNNHVYEDFVHNSKNIITNYIQGDAVWIREKLYDYEYLQDVFPDKLISYKANCINKYTGKITIPPNASIVCFHGKPRPHTITNPLFTSHWMYE